MFLEAKEATFTIREFTNNDSQKEAFVDLNGNLKKDEGEEFEADKEYTVTAERVSIVGEIIQRLEFESNNLHKAEVTHRYIKNLSFDDASLESVVIINAQSLETLDVSPGDSKNNLKELVLPDDKQKIANLKELTIANCPNLPRTEVFKSLPNRTGKDPIGRVSLSIVDNELSEKEKEILKDLHWEIFFYDK